LKQDRRSREPDWLQVSFAIEAFAHEALSRFLFDLGCTGITVEEEGDYTLRAFFRAQDEGATLVPKITSFLCDLKSIFPDLAPPKIQWGKIADQDWSVRWRSFFQPVRITPALLVVPPWEPAVPGSGTYVIRIDPGLAFGTGQHATTQMCLESMESLSLGRSWTMLDVGTGSGILAIYAAMLGATRILAIDTDRDALKSAGENTDLNGLATAIEFSSQPLETLSGSFSLIMANLILGTILDLIPHLQRLLAPDGYLVLSGIMRGQVDELGEKIVLAGLQTERTSYRMDWACLVVRHRMRTTSHDHAQRTQLPISN
jgi:ribosomal protein L11 methyltransferase